MFHELFDYSKQKQPKQTVLFFLLISSVNFFVVVVHENCIILRISILIKSKNSNTKEKTELKAEG
jgi:hypothetical protein